MSEKGPQVVSEPAELPVGGNVLGGPKRSGIFWKIKSLLLKIWEFKWSVSSRSFQKDVTPTSVCTVCWTSAWREACEGEESHAESFDGKQWVCETCQLIEVLEDRIRKDDFLQIELRGLILFIEQIPIRTSREDLILAELRNIVYPNETRSSNRSCGR